MMLEDDLKKNKKLYILVCVFIICGIILSLVKQELFKSGKLTEQQLYNSFYESARQISNDSLQRKNIADCWMEKLKEKYQNKIEDIDLEADKNILDSITSECFSQIVKISWTPEIEKRLLARISSAEELKSITYKMRSSCALCVLTKIKGKYPKGLNLNRPIPQTIMDEFYASCLEELKNSSSR